MKNPDRSNWQARVSGSPLGAHCDRLPPSLLHEGSQNSARTQVSAAFSNREACWGPIGCRGDSSLCPRFSSPVALLTVWCISVCGAVVKKGPKRLVKPRPLKRECECPVFIAQPCCKCRQWTWHPSGGAVRGGSQGKPQEGDEVQGQPPCCPVLISTKKQEDKEQKNKNGLVQAERPSFAEKVLQTGLA